MVQLRWSVFLATLLVAITLAEEDGGNDYETWEAPAEIRKAFVYYLSGFDEENRPIWIGECGKWPVRDFFEAENGAENEILLRKYIDQALYRYNQSLSLRSTPDSPVTEGNVILDLEGLELRTLTHTKTIKFGLEKARDVEIVARRMAKGAMVNMNYVAHRLVEILKPVLGKSVERTDFYGTNNATWIPQLLKNFPKKSLPPFYGGDEDFTPVAIYG